MATEARVERYHNRQLRPVVQSLLDLSPGELEKLALELGEPSYRGRQLAHWLHWACVDSFEAMTDLPRPLRARLEDSYAICRANVLRDLRSSDCLTRKVLLQFTDGQAVESVEMVAPGGKRGHDRRTVCVSSQAGCPVGCIFCATGRSGFARNLQVGEILEQIYFFFRTSGRRATNIVFMGMGEPLANYDATVQAIRILNSPLGHRIGARNITVSTSGIEPQMRRLAREGLQIGLAVSLHAPDNELRSRLVPLNRRFPVEAVVDAALEYAQVTGRRVTFEYTMIAGINDSVALARDLVRLLLGKPFHVNLIPLNPIDDPSLAPSTPETIEAFRQVLVRAGVPCTIRRNRGQDITAACGQLRLRSLKPTPSFQPEEMRCQ